MKDSLKIVFLLFIIESKIGIKQKKFEIENTFKKSFYWKLYFYNTLINQIRIWLNVIFFLFVYRQMFSLKTTKSIYVLYYSLKYLRYFYWCKITTFKVPIKIYIAWSFSNSLAWIKVQHRKKEEKYHSGFWSIISATEIWKKKIFLEKSYGFYCRF